MTTQAKEIVFADEARVRLATGVLKLTEAVKFTLGPKGRHAGLEKSWGAPQITNDGDSIVKDISLENQFEDMGVAMAKEVARKLKDTCGDGTTTGTILLNALVQSSVKYVAAGHSPIVLKRGLDKAVEAVVNQIKKLSIAVSSQEDTRNIATVSASGNLEIGQTIADAVERVGKSGVVTVEEGKGTECTVEIVEGMRFDRGYISPYFCTDQDKMTVEMHNPAILLVEKKISSVQEILSILEHVATLGRELLIIAEDLDADALATLVVNKLRGILRVAAVKAPGFGDRRKAMLEDIAILTGGHVISEDSGVLLKDATADVLGSSGRVIITKDHTTLVSGAGDEAKIAMRIRQIESELEKTTSSYDKEKLQERKAKLSGGVAVIKVGAPTEPEMKQKKQMFEDSLSSTLAALEEGVVLGGGTALLRAAQQADFSKLEGDEALAAHIVAAACEAPLRQLVTNAGLEASVVLSQVKEAKGSIGFNANSQAVEDLQKAGVIDPTKVTVSSLLYAASVAGVIVLSEALIGDADEDSN